MTPDKNYRMTPATKALIALSGGTKADRAAFKAGMIQGELAAEAARRQALKSNKKEVQA